MIESRVDQLVEDARRAIKIHDGVLALKAERDELWQILSDILGHWKTTPADLRFAIEDGAHGLFEAIEKLSSDDRFAVEK
jgi:hypothetical protein